MRTVFLSFLGASDYLPVHYILKDTRTKQRRKFVQSAILETLGFPVDKVILLCTEEAKVIHSESIR